MINTGKKPVETYGYIWADQDGTTIDCFKSTNDKQTVCKLWEVSALAFTTRCSPRRPTKSTRSSNGWRRAIGTSPATCRSFNSETD